MEVLEAAGPETGGAWLESSCPAAVPELAEKNRERTAKALAGTSFPQK